MKKRTHQPGAATVILAAGDFPRKGGAARAILDSARRVVCCDGAARAYARRTGRAADVVVGDLDSLGRGVFAAETVRVAEQDTNDLAKAIRLCRRRGWDRPVVLGATGGREDHALGNVFRAMDEGLEVVTDRGRFVPFRRRLSLDVAPGTAVSVFATDRETEMASSGLKWPLAGVRFENLYCATLNRADSPRVVLTTSRPAFVYVAS